MTDRDVVIVGGGFAGLSAAVKLAQMGHSPLLLERRPSLGGRAYSFTHGETGDTVDNGQHVLMRCCHAVLAFLETIESDPVHFDDRFSIPFVDDRGRRHRLEAPLWLPPSLGLLVAFLKFGPTSWRDATGLRRALPYFQSPPNGISVSQWLDEVDQSDAIRRAFWHPLCLSVLNAPPETAPAGELLTVLAEAFSQQAGASLGWSTVGLSGLYTEQARAFIERHHGEVRTGIYVDEVDADADRLQLTLRGRSTLATAALILAVPPPRASQLLATTILEPLLTRLKTFKPSPILGINLWFDRPILEEPFIGLLDATVEWVFNKSVIFGRSRQASVGHLSLVVSASTALLLKSDEELVDVGLEDLRRAGLINSDERPVHSLVIHEKQATYSRPVTSDPIPIETDIPGLLLAGDWTDTGLPPTIESAVRSGNRAADLVDTYLKRKKPGP